MRTALILCAALLALSISACQKSNGRREPSGEEILKYQRAASEYDTLATQLAQSVPLIGEPLRGLNKEQQASIAALLLIARVAAEQQALSPVGERQQMDTVWLALSDVCPPLRTAHFSRGGCLDADIAYASAMAGCLKEGKTEAECELYAAPWGAAAVACRMKELEGLQGIIGRLPGRAWPPRPFPWPIEK